MSLSPDSITVMDRGFTMTANNNARKMFEKGHSVTFSRFILLMCCCSTLLAIFGSITSSQAQHLRTTSLPLLAGISVPQASAGSMNDVAWIFGALSVFVALTIGIAGFLIWYTGHKHGTLLQEMNNLWEQQIQIYLDSVVVERVNELVTQGIGEIKSDLDLFADRYLGMSSDERHLAINSARMALWSGISDRMRKGTSRARSDQAIDLWSIFFRSEGAMLMLTSIHDHEIFTGIAYFYTLLEDDHLKDLVPKAQIWRLICLLKKQRRLTKQNQHAALELKRLLFPDKEPNGKERDPWGDCPKQA